MNRHTKLAIILAPFLLVGGYIASDQYIEYRANQPKMFQLLPQSECDIFGTECILESGDMLINLTDNNGITKANTSYPVDSVAISLVYKNGNETIYVLEQAGNAQYWQRETEIRSAITDFKSAEKLRVLIKIKGHIYLAEFLPKADTI
jgi:hypothetical protein